MVRKVSNDLISAVTTLSPLSTGCITQSKGKSRLEHYCDRLLIHSTGKILRIAGLIASLLYFRNNSDKASWYLSSLFAATEESIKTKESAGFLPQLFGSTTTSPAKLPC